MNHPISHRAAALTLSCALITALGACSADDEPDAAPPPTDPAETTSSAADCPPITGNHIDLDPGCWALEVPGLPPAHVAVPAGFVGQPGGLWLPNEFEDPNWGHLGITTVGDVFPDPCTRTEAPPSNSATINDFAEALAAQKVSTTTAPVPVSLGGHDGLQVTLSVPADFDASQCTEGELATWQVRDGELEGIDSGTDLGLWVVDVDRAPVVLVMTTNADSPEETVDLLTDIVESATFPES